MKRPMKRFCAVMFYLAFAISLLGNWISREVLEERVRMFIEGVKGAPLTAHESHEFDLRRREDKQQMMKVFRQLIVQAFINPPKAVRGKLMVQKDSSGRPHTPTLYIIRQWDQDTHVMRLTFVGLPTDFELSDGNMIASRR